MRALPRWGITPLLAAPLGAWALGLGDIELQSALNQPFQAEIALVSATPEEVQGLRIALAPRETFEQRGLDRADFLSTLEFRVAKDRAGRDVVRVTSREPITEPFVTMLVDASWARGRLLREYTVLLDPPVLLPEPAAPQAVQPPQSRAVAPNAAGGAINRPAPAPAPAPPARTPAPAVAPAPVRQPAPGPSSNAAPPPRTPTQPSEGSYGPVQRSETLWKIAEQFKPDGISMNQMMVAVYQANPRAFLRGNMNLLQVGAVLQIPDAAALQSLERTAANAEVQRQTDEWQGRPPQQARLILVPPTEASGAATAPAAAAGGNAPAPQAPAPAGAAPPAAAATAANAAEERRLLEVRDEQLRNLQQQARAAETPNAAPAPAPAAPAPAPGVDIEPEPLFADEAQAPEVVAPAPEPAAVAPVPRTIVEPQSSLGSQILGWLATPILWIGLGAAALILAGLWFVRRRREVPEETTGRWQELGSADEDETRETAERMRRQQAQEQSFVVEEQAARPRAAELDVDLDDDLLAEEEAAATRTTKPVIAEDTLSSQTVINLDQADPVAEADFHMAYGLYDQAAELVSKALQAAPNRRDLKLKLLEVFFVWGNKDAFLNAAKGLRKEIGDRPDADWDKVVIMGKQICPEAPLFAEAKVASGPVDLNLESGTSPALDFAFEDTGNRAAPNIDLDLTDGDSDSDDAGLDIDIGDLEIETSAARRANQARRTADRSADSEDSLNIGESTAAGLEALFLDDSKDPAAKTAADIDIDTQIDALEVTQESPTVEARRSDKDRSRHAADSPTVEFSAFETPTIETPTIESPGSEAPTMETPTIETRHRGDARTIEQFAGNLSDRTAEIDLDDLGLDIKDLEDLPGDLGDLPSGSDNDSDTRDQPGLDLDDELLSATGVTQVLRFEDEVEHRTSTLSDDDATMLSPSEVDTLRGTEVLEHRFDFDESGDTSLVKALRRDDGLDLNLDDLSAALHGSGDTVEQPRSSSFSGDVFGGRRGDTPLDLDIGMDVLGSDDPTGTENANPLDPQTMTEVGTKLDLARAYIDMGDPEGARSILEEVLDEGDSAQRREAQSLIDVLAS